MCHHFPAGTLIRRAESGQEGSSLKALEPQQAVSLSFGIKHHYKTLSRRKTTVRGTQRSRELRGYCIKRGKRSWFRLGRQGSLVYFKKAARAGWWAGGGMRKEMARTTPDFCWVSSGVSIYWEDPTGRASLSQGMRLRWHTQQRGNQRFGLDTSSLQWLLELWGENFLAYTYKIWINAVFKTWHHSQSLTEGQDKRLWGRPQFKS